MIDRVPLLTDSEITAGIHQAKISPRKRYAKVLHEEGAEFNEVFNFINQASYMPLFYFLMKQEKSQIARS